MRVSRSADRRARRAARRNQRTQARKKLEPLSAAALVSIVSMSSELGEMGTAAERCWVVVWVVARGLLWTEDGLTRSVFNVKHSVKQRTWCIFGTL